MSEEESCTPFALRRSCARTGLCTPSTVAYLTFDVAPTGYLQKEARPGILAQSCGVQIVFLRHNFAGWPSLPLFQ